MAELFDRVRTAIAETRYVIGQHAAMRLRQRRIESWQVAGATVDGRLLVERPESRPNPALEVEILLPDGTAAKAVWSWLAQDDVAKLVTVHFFDR